MGSGLEDDGDTYKANEGANVVLLIGACCLDRLLYVPTYPEADSKIRTTSYVEMGGGNAANTATALARLMGNTNYRIQLLSKVGDDAVGSAIIDELESDGVDLSSPLFSMEQGKTTSVTTILVAEDDSTRTCLHTPGTCGELTVDDVSAATAFSNGGWDAIFRNVVHVHSDCRHGDAAALVVKEAQRRHIPVSVDAEKDRKTVEMDQILQESTIIFTNEQQLEAYTQRKRPLSVRTKNTSTSSNVDPFFVRTAQLFYFFLQMYPKTNQESKQIISTRGSKGSTHVTCRGVNSQQLETENDATFTVVRPQGRIVVEQRVEETTAATYDIRSCGIVHNNHVVDTTGAGDAFIGGYICALLLWQAKHMELNRFVDLCLSFAAWVASKKVGGTGARETLPYGQDLEKELGTSAEEVERNLQALLQQPKTSE